MLKSGNEDVSQCFEESFHPVSESFQQRSRSFQKPFQKREWNEKAQRNAENNRYVPVKAAVNLILLAGCFTETLMELDQLYQVISYILLFSVFMATDPLDALTRYLAPQTRYIAALCGIMIIVVIIRPYRPLVMIVCFIVTLGLTAIKIFNQSWLASYNWLMSAAVQNALLYDLDNKATKAWHAHGRRETRTLLHEMGYQATDDILDILHRPVYLCGYMNGYKKEVKYKQKLQRIENVAENYKDQLQEVNAQLQNLKKESQAINKDYMQLQARLQEETQQSTHWYQMYQAEHKLAVQLQSANEELVSVLESSADQVIQGSKLVEIKAQSMEDKVLSALAAGASYADAGRIAGCSKSKAYRIHKDSKESGENKIITIG